MVVPRVAKVSGNDDYRRAVVSRGIPLQGTGAFGMLLQLPFVACNRGTRSPRPTVTRLAECLGLKRQIRTEPFDLVIVGAGPAGLAAAVYGASEGLATIVLDRFGPG